MKQSINTLLNMSEMVYGAYRYRSKAGFLLELEHCIRLIARNKKDDEREISRQYNTLVSGILGYFLDNELNRVIKAQAFMVEKSWLEKTVEGKIASIMEEFDHFIDRFEGGQGRISDQVLHWIQDASLDDFRDMTVESLARRFGKSPSYFSKTFKKEQGINLSKSLNSAKLSCAYRILKQGNAQSNLEELSSRLGFRDVDHFRKSFKRKYGRPPSRLHAADQDETV